LARKMRAQRGPEVMLTPLVMILQFFFPSRI
jgi:hypothetical protein